MSNFDFFRTNINDDTFQRTPGRMMWAGETIAFPTQISEVVNLSNYDPMANWFDFGATKEGIQVSRNNTEETFDVDQVFGDIETLPNGWEMTVQANLSEVDYDGFKLGWQTSDTISTNASADGGPEATLGFGTPLKYKKIRLGVLAPKQNGKLRGVFFRVAQRMPQESTITYNKTGAQQQIPVRFKCLPDTSIADMDNRFGAWIEQV